MCPTDSKRKRKYSVFYNIRVLMFMYYAVRYVTSLFYAVVRQISMLFIDSEDSVFCLTQISFSALRFVDSAHRQYNKGERRGRFFLTHGLHTAIPCTL